MCTFSSLHGIKEALAVARMLFHPITLKFLYEWKTSEDKAIPLDLLALIVDCKPVINYDELDSILYGYKKATQRKRERLESLKAIVESKFVLEQVSDGSSEPGPESMGDPVYLLRDHSEVSRNTSRLLKMAQKAFKKSKRMEKRTENSGRENSISMQETPVKRTQNQSNTSILKFIKIEDRKEKAELTKLGPFMPICFDGNTIISSQKAPLKSTVRMRRDVQDPKRLFFIKFSDQLRPPIYRFRTEKLNVRNSLTRLPQILDYDCDSDWEDEEEAETIDSTEEDSDEVEESSQEWIDSDMESIEPTRSNKKPSLTFPPCKFTVLASFPGNWLQMPLVERDTFPEEHLEILKEDVAMAAHVPTFAKEFSGRYVIRLSVVSKKLRELGYSKDSVGKDFQENENLF